MKQIKYIYGRCVGLNLGQSPTLLSSGKGVATVSKQLSLWSYKSARYQKHQRMKSLPIFILSNQKLKKKKDCYKWQFMATFHTQLWVVLPQTKHHLPHFHLTWMAAHPHPSPQCSLSLRWIAYLHSHMTPRGKGARLCASLTRVASALTVPLFSLRDSGVPGTLLLSRLPCPSVGRTGRLCPGEITEHLCGAERRASDRWRSLQKNWVSLHFVSLLQLLFHRLL